MCSRKFLESELQVGRGLKTWRKAAFRSDFAGSDRSSSEWSLSGLQALCLSFVSLGKAGRSLEHPLAYPQLSLPGFSCCAGMSSIIQVINTSESILPEVLCFYEHVYMYVGASVHVHVCFHMHGRSQRLTRVSSLISLHPTF